LIFIDSAAAAITIAMGGTLGVTMLYMAHLKFHDTVEMLRVRLGLELSKGRLESAVRTLGIGLEIQDSSGEVVFANAIMEDNRDAITHGTETREGFSFWQGRYYRRTEFNGVEGDQIELIEDVSSLVESQQTILQSRQQAEQALQTKSAFFESISREVIYPIRTIMKYARLLQPDSRIRFDDDELGNLADLIMNASKDLERLMSSMTRHSLDENAHMVDAEMIKLREIFREELTEMAKQDLDDVTLRSVINAVPEDLLVKSSASGSLTRALGQMCLKAYRTVGHTGKLTLHVRAMPDDSDDICFIVRGLHDQSGGRPGEKLGNDPTENAEVTLDAFASYMSATHIANLGGKYHEDLTGEKAVNLVAVVPSDHVQSVGETLKTLPLKAAAH
jgi:signal transduction histidine kinase